VVIDMLKGAIAQPIREQTSGEGARANVPRLQAAADAMEQRVETGASMSAG
jgi:hypothetical protein